MRKYYVNGLTVQSDLVLPCDENYFPIHDITNASVSIRYGGSEPKPFTQVHWIGQRPWSRCYNTGDGILVCALNEFKMHVNKNGEEITLFYKHESLRASGMAAACAVNLGLASCLLLRGQLPLHAASAKIDEHLIGWMAPSGTGKTTTLWHILNQGYLLCSDDMTTTNITIEGVIATPTMTQHAKVSQEVLERRGIDRSSYSETYPGSEEYWLPMASEQRLQSPRSLDALFVLSPTPHLATVGRFQVRRAFGAEALPLLWNNMQGLAAVADIINREKFARDCLELARRVPLFVIQYHKCFQALPALVNLMVELTIAAKKEHKLSSV